MRRRGLLWGIVLLLVGVLLLLNNLAIIAVDIWSAILAVTFIVVGVGLLLNIVAGRGYGPGEEVYIPLGDAIGARVRVRHGAGRLKIDGSAQPGVLLEGRFGNGLTYRKQRMGDEVAVELSPRGLPIPLAPWTWGGQGFAWSFGLNPEIPLTLSVETGASEVRMDLTELRVRDLRIQTGASSVNVTLPAHARHTRARVEAGAASVSLSVPPGVAARVRFQGALTSVDIDPRRFPRGIEFHQSPDYDRAENTIDIDVEAGVGSIRVC